MTTSPGRAKLEETISQLIRQKLLEFDPRLQQLKKDRDRKDLEYTKALVRDKEKELRNSRML